MNKKEFMKNLKEHLVGLPKEDVKEILEDYEEHFKIGKKNKRKESEIAKSLGEPKKIAREARHELNSREDIDFENWFVESWVKFKHFVVKIGKNVKREIPHAKKSLINAWNSLVKNNPPKKKKSKNTKKNFWKRFSLICLDVFLMIWLLISLFAVAVSLFISGIAISISGVSMVVFAIMGLLAKSSVEFNNLFLSLLFSGIGVGLFGVLFSKVSVQAWKGLSWITKKYFKFHKKIFGGKNE